MGTPAVLLLGIGLLLPWLLVAETAAQVLPPAFGQAEGEDSEISAFQMTSYEGANTVRFIDERASSKGAGADSRQGRTQLGNELSLTTHSYVYHPNFVALDMGGSLFVQRNHLTNEQDASSELVTPYDLLLRARVLHGKPVSGSLFFEHLNPSVAVSPGQVLEQQHSRTGFDVSATEQAISTPLRISYVHAKLTAEGADRVMDDVSDQWDLTVSQPWGHVGSSQMHLQTNWKDSVSGSPDLPIQPSSSTSQSAELDTRLKFGPADSYEFSKYLAVNRHRYDTGGVALPAENDLSLSLDLRAKHSPDISSFSTYRLNYGDQTVQTSTSHALGMGVRYLPVDGLETSVGVRGEKQDATDSRLRNLGLDGSASYRQPLPLGTAQLTYTSRFDRRDLVALRSAAQVIDERLIFNGATSVALGNQRVVSNSVVVRNNTRTQTYVENIDYVLTVIGVTTRLQRLVGGAILNGEEVLVEYAYDLGGTYGYDQWDQTGHISWSVGNYIHLYLREFVSNPQVTSGNPSFPLNQIRSHLVGGRSDIPFDLGVSMSVGGNAELERVDETITPLTRHSAELYWQTNEPVWDVGNVGLTLEQSRTDYAASDQDMGRHSLALRLQTNRWGVDFTAHHTLAWETSGLVETFRQIDSAHARWREGKLTVTGRLEHARETQNAYDKSNSLIHLTVRRDF